jgi:hypothetical protein
MADAIQGARSSASSVSLTFPSTWYEPMQAGLTPVFKDGSYFSHQNGAKHLL